MPKKEMVNHPDHYGGDTTYEVIKVLEAWELDKDAYLFNVVKYIARCGKKDNELQELKKAKWYLDRKIEKMEKKDQEVLKEKKFEDLGEDPTKAGLGDG